MADDETFVRIRTHNTDTIVKALGKRIEDIEKECLSDQAKKEVAQLYAEYVEPYVPMSDPEKNPEAGFLRRSAYVPDDTYKGDYYVLYDAPYAKAQYKGKTRGAVLHWTTPGTRDHWNKHMSTATRAAFHAKVKETLLKRIKHG